MGIEILETAEKILNGRQNGFLLVGSQDSIIFETVQLCYTRACIATEIGNFSDSLKHFQLGLDCFNEGIKRGFRGFQLLTEESLYGGIANSLNSLRRVEEAEQHYLKCIELKQPGDTDPVYDINLNRCLWPQGPKRYEDASNNLLDIIAERERHFGPEDTKDYM